MRHKGLLEIVFPFLATAFLVTSIVLPGTAAPGVSDCLVDGNRVTVTLEAGEYRVSETQTGQRLEMEGFDHLKIPGRPLLPMKRFLIALPPGAVAESIEILDADTERLPNTYRIVPCPPIAFLPDMPRWEEAMQRVQSEWQAEYDATLQSDASFPGEVAWLAGRGTLRKYSYASVAFCPFAYQAQSGHLEYTGEVRIAINCGYPLQSDSESQLLEQLMQDHVADERASELFANYSSVAGLYPYQNNQAPLPDETYDYVIITFSGLVNAIADSDFSAWKTSKGHNLRTVLTTDEEITSQPGVDLAEKIRNFLRAYYATWSIEYVLFVGDYATVPMRICYPDPDYHVYDPSDPGLIAPGTPTDHYHADLSFPDEFSWDSDGDGYHGEYGDDEPDFLSEVSVGRIPVNSPTRITYTLNKMVAFEQDEGEWKNNVLHGTSILFFENQDNSGYPFIDGASVIDSMETALMGHCNITHLSEQAGIVTSYFDWPPISETSFTTLWGFGEHAIVNWSGHGWSDGAYRTIWAWDDGDGIPEHGNGELQSYRFIGLGASNVDDDYPSVIFAISCNVGYPDPNPYGNLGIDLLTVPDWGASTGIVSSARPASISGDWRNDPGGTEQICYDFNRYMCVEKARVGDALYFGKFDATTVYGWDRVYEYMNLYNFNLFGDPALDVGAPTSAVHDIGGPVRELLSLRPGVPNPFGSMTSLRLAVSKPDHVSITVHDVAGREVATLASQRFAAGEHEVTWDGAGYEGERLGSGLYFIIAETSGGRTSSKVMLLR